MSNHEQLTYLKNYDINNLFFCKPKYESAPMENGSDIKLNYIRINIKTKYKNNVYGNLIIPTEEELYSFGVQVNRFNKTRFDMGICCWSKENPTPEQKQWTDKFSEIIEKVKKHLLSPEVTEETGQDNPKFDYINDLLYWKREVGKDGKRKKNGRIIEGTGPIINPKVILTKPRNSIFNDNYGNVIEDPLTIGRCFVTAAIRLESIYVGKDIISVQMKLHQAVVRTLDQNLRPMLDIKPPPEEDSVTESTALNPLLDKSTFEDEPVIYDSDNDENTVELPKVTTVDNSSVKKVTRKRK